MNSKQKLKVTRTYDALNMAEREITCRRCNTIFKHHSANKQYCSDCVRSKKKEENQRSNKKRKQAAPILLKGKLSERDLHSANIEEKLAVPFLNECQTIESDKSKFIVFDIGDDIKKSNSLSDWSSLLDAYGEYEGDVFEYKPSAERSLWIKTSYNSRMKLKEWNIWFQNEQKKPVKKRKCLYLTGLPLSSVDIECLHNNPLVNAFACCGQLDLTSYILKVSRDIPIPQMDFIFLISPPWGNIMTFPHLDGFGSQLSTHCFLMGNGENLIHLWPKLDEVQSYYFRDVLSLPSITEDQKQPHDLEHYVDSSVEVWDEKLEKKLHKYGIKSTCIKIVPGQGVILPHGKYHCFKKINRNESNQNGDAIPLVSCACDASYIGIDNVWNNYQIIKRCHQIFKIKYSLYELGLLCLFKTCQAVMLDNNSIIYHHAKGGLPLFKQWIDEQKRLLNKLGNPSLVADVQRMEEEIECNNCKNPISNFFRTAPKNHYLCLKCSKEKSRESSPIHYRIFDINTAEKLFEKVNNGIQKLNASHNQPISMDLEITGMKKNKNSSSNNVPAKRRNNTNENVAQPDASNNNDLEKEIESFIPVVKDIWEGRVVTERAKQWRESSSQARRSMHYSCFGGFEDKELDYIFNTLVKKMQNESSSPVAPQPHHLVAFILDVVWPELGIEILSSRKGISKEEAKKILENDSHYERERIESIFQ